MAKDTGKTKQASQKRGSISGQKESIYKKSPQVALEELFKENLGPKSPLIQALKDNPIVDSLEEHTKELKSHQKDLKKVGEANKALVKGILTSTTKLATVAKSLEGVAEAIKSPKTAPQIKTTGMEKQIDRLLGHFKTNNITINKLAGNFKDVRTVLLRQHRFNIERELYNETKQMEAASERDLSPTAPTSTHVPLVPSQGMGYLENRSAQLIGKGFHFITGALSEFINKKVLGNQSPTIQENLSEDQQSPQHKNYLRTKAQVGVLFDIFKTEEKRDKKIDKLDQTVKVGDEKVVNSINSLHDTLKEINKRSAIATDTATDKEEAEMYKQKAAQAVVQRGNVVYMGGGDQGLLSNILNATKGLAETVSKVLPTVIPATKSLLQGAKTLALRPVGFAAGMSVIGAAAVGAAYFMDKESRKMLDAGNQQLNSEILLEQQQRKMQRESPAAYKLTKLREKMGEIRMLPQTDATKRSLDTLSRQYNDILKSNAVQPAPDEGTNTEGIVPDTSKFQSSTATGETNADLALVSKSPAIPTSTTQLKPGDVSSSVDEMHDGVVNELRDGKMVDILGEIRDGIQNLKSSSGENKSSLMGPSLDSDLVAFNTKSTIATQRDSMRSVMS